MGVFFHIVSTGGGTGASRATRYIAERDRDPLREGPGSRPLFAEDQEGLSYRRADRLLDPRDGRPEKNDLLHFSVMIEEEEFNKLGATEKEKQSRFREVIREGIKGLAEELNVARLTWVAGIHRNSENPHAHVVMRKDAVERGTGRHKLIGRLRKSLLPHKEIENGKEVLVPGRIGERFLSALRKQQALYLAPPEKQRQASPQQLWDEMVARMQKLSEERRERAIKSPGSEITKEGQTRQTTRLVRHRGTWFADRREQAQIAASWNEQATTVFDHDQLDARLALGKRLELNIRLAFAQMQYDRAVEHGETYRFAVMDQSMMEERRISELDVHRRASARATRTGERDYRLRNQAIEADLARHRDTLHELTEAREAKISALAKDLSSLAGQLRQAEQRAPSIEQDHDPQNLVPLMNRHTLSQLQEEAIKLNLPEHVRALEHLRIALAEEHQAPARTDIEAARLAAQLQVARADLRARDARLENFDASIHLTSYDVTEERWSLGALDKQLSRRREDAKIIPRRAARLDLRSLVRLNYSPSHRAQATAEVEHLNYVREGLVREIEQRRAPLIEERNRALGTLALLEHAHDSEHEKRARAGLSMPEPKYQPHEVKALEGSAELLRDPQLLREVHVWEKAATKNDPAIDWEGRSVAREIMAHLAVAETRERLQHFLEARRGASLHLGGHRTGTLREVEARSVTEYLTRAIIETHEQRDHRHTVKLAAREQHGRLVTTYEQAKDYHDAAREFAAEAKDREPKFTDKERINLEIYAERQNDAAERERYLEMARGESHAKEREVSVARSR